MNPLPDNRKVHALILQHERQREVAVSRDVAGHVANFTYKKMQNRPTNNMDCATSSRRNLHRTYCDMDGDTIDRCFFIHGFPLRHKYHVKDVKPKGSSQIPRSILM